jgi:hypothetical protein
MREPNPSARSIARTGAWRLLPILAACCLARIAHAAEDPLPASGDPGPPILADLRGQWSYDAIATAAYRQSHAPGRPADTASPPRFDNAATITVADDHLDTASFIGLSFTMMSWRIVGDRRGRVELEGKDGTGAAQRAAIARDRQRMAWIERDEVVALFSRAAATPRCCSDPLPRSAKR